MKLGLNTVSYMSYLRLEKLIPHIAKLGFDQIEVIGEAAKKVSSELKNGHPEIPWKDVAGMREKLIHNYFGVDLDAVWDTVEKDVPRLKDGIRAIIGNAE